MWMEIIAEQIAIQWKFFSLIQYNFCLDETMEESYIAEDEGG